MARTQKVEYHCTACGQTHTKWHGKCPACGEWNTLVERSVSKPTLERHARRVGAQQHAKRAVPIAQVDLSDAQRHPVGLSELEDRKSVV